MVHSFCLSGTRLQAQPEYTGNILEFCLPDESERVWLEQEAGLGSHDIASALDADEIGRFDLWEDELSIILKTPRNYSSEDLLVFKVSSLGVFRLKGRLIIISSRETPILAELAQNRLRDLGDVIIRLLSGTVAHFLGHIRVIGMISDSLEEKASSSMANESLLNMFKIEKSLVYYINGISANTVLMEKIRTHGARLGLDEDHLDRLEDALVDNQQCEKQTRIQADIMESLMATRSSIMNNNMNTLIKRLTIVNVVFMPLNLLASMGGMSEYTALTKDMGFIIRWGIFLISLGLLGSLTYFIIRRYSEEEGEPASRKPARFRRHKHK